MQGLGLAEAIKGPATAYTHGQGCRVLGSSIAAASGSMCGPIVDKEGGKHGVFVCVCERKGEGEGEGEGEIGGI